jgi:arylsulfatase
MYNKIQNADLNGKEFVFFNLMDVHSSSGRSTGQAIAEGVSDANKLHKCYRNSVKKLSEDYRQLFSHLYNKFDWVITLSDHGELLGEYNLSGHGYGIYPELVQVPLVISSQNNICSYPTEDLVSLLDIPSTIRDICDIDDYGRGNSLLDKQIRRKAPVERLGQPHLHEDMFLRYDIIDKFEKYNKSLRGMAINKKGYAYETMSGLEYTEGWRKDGEAEITEFFDDIDIFSIMKGNLDVSSDVQQRLKDLGYA